MARAGRRDVQRCEECGREGRVGKKVKPRDAPARMTLLGDLVATDSSTPIMLERDCVHQDGGPHRMLTVSLVAQLHCSACYGANMNKLFVRGFMSTPALPHNGPSLWLPSKLDWLSPFYAAPPPAFIRDRDITGCRCRGGSSSFARPREGGRPPRLTPPTSTAGLVGMSLPAAFLACSADAAQLVDGGCECCAPFAPGAAAALLLGPAR